MSRAAFRLPETRNGYRRSVGASGQVYRTSRTEDLEPLPAVAIEAYRVVLEVPAYSVSTFVIPMP